MARRSGLAAALAAVALSELLYGCATSTGRPTDRVAVPAIEAAYIPLHRSTLVPLPPYSGAGAAMVISPGVAVTNAHNQNMVPRGRVIGTAEPNYDLLFFETDRRQAPPSGIPRLGRSVIAYGQDAWGALRTARGIIRQLPSATEDYFIFEGDAGEGFSGGPVVDAADGTLLGIVWAYRDAEPGRQNLVYAYDIARVRSLFSDLQNRLPVDVN